MSKPKLRTSSNYLPKCSITERVKNNINTRKAIFFTALSADMKVKFRLQNVSKKNEGKKEGKKERKKERKKIGDCFFRVTLGTKGYMIVRFSWEAGKDSLTFFIDTCASGVSASCFWSQL